MCCSCFSAIGFLWGFVSIFSSLLTSVGFFLPFWIEGELLGGQQTSFGCFSRCGFAQLTNSGIFEIESACGRYATFDSIPTGWWQLSSVLVGTGATISILVAVTMLISLCCSQDLINPTSAKVLGWIQLCSGFVVLVGMLVYPLGWGSREVLEACSESSGPYHLGTCRISWSFYLIGAGVLLGFGAFGLSHGACRKKKGTYRI